MFIGCFTMISLWLHSNRSDYITSSVQLWGGSIMYVSYLLLFGHFFYKTYLSPGPKRKSQQETSTVSATCESCLAAETTGTTY